MADWDPRSYLAEAAAAHVMAIDTDATATTIINYYDSIAAHFSASERHKAIAAQLAPQSVAAADRSATTSSPALSRRPVASAASFEVGFGAEDARNHAPSKAHPQVTPPTAIPLPCTGDSDTTECFQKGDLLVLSGVHYEMPWKVLCTAPSPSASRGSSSSSASAPQSSSVGVAEKVLATVQRCFVRCGEVFHPGHTSAAPDAQNVASEMNSLYRGSGRHNADSDAPKRVSDPLRTVLRVAAFLHRVTDGQYDPTHAAEAAVWKWCLRHEKVVPSAASAGVQEALTEAEAVSGWERLRFDSEHGTVCPPAVAGPGRDTSADDSAPPSDAFSLMMMGAAATAAAPKPEPPSRRCPLDLSSLAKGHAVDEIFEALWRELGAEAYFYRRDSSRATEDSGPVVLGGLLVDWGGDIRSIGTNPITGRPWLVGLVQPLKLKLLFDAWYRAGGANCNRRDYIAAGEKQYLHAIPLPVSGGALATSGDYEQLQKWGHTHLWDTKGKRPFKVQNHTLASATALAPTCVEADGLATALMVSNSMLRGLDLIIRVRKELGLGQTDDAAGAEPRQPLAAGTPCRLLRYYLYERNHQTFVHDEEDEFLGSGDEMRRMQADKETQKAAAFHVVASVTTAGTANKSDAIVAYLKRLTRCQPATAAIATVALAVESGGPNRPPAASSGPGRAQRVPFHAVALTSVVMLRPPTAADGRPGVVTFNVMKGSALFNYTRSPGMTLCLHLLSAAFAHHWADLQQNQAAWIASVEPCWFTSPRAAAPDAGGRVMGVAELAPTCFVCSVSFVVECGDHIVVQAELDPAAAVAAEGDEGHARTACAAAPSLLTPLLQVHGGAATAAAAAAPPQGPGSDQRVALAHNVWRLSTPAVVFADHPMYGRMGFPVRGVRLCSLDPPMVSLYAVSSAVVKEFAATRVRRLRMGQSATPPMARHARGTPCELVLLAAQGPAAGAAPASGGDPFDPFVRGRTNDLPCDARDHDDEWSAVSNAFSFLPFPALDARPRGAAVSVSLTAVGYFDDIGAGADAEGSAVVTFVMAVERVVVLQDGLLEEADRCQTQCSTAGDEGAVVPPLLLTYCGCEPVRELRR